jgi:hypothetical protein
MELKRQNYISVDNKTAINSYGEYFTIGDIVYHDDNTAEPAAKILSFEPNIEKNEVKVNTDKGFAHIDSISKEVRPLEYVLSNNDFEDAQKESDKIQSRFQNLIAETMKLNPKLTYESSMTACLIMKLGELQSDINKINKKLLD